jgi:hypothetical protein
MTYAALSKYVGAKTKWEARMLDIPYAWCDAKHGKAYLRAHKVEAPHPSYDIPCQET